MNKIELATKKHSEGYNCAQAVACAYCDNVGLDEETLFQLTSGLGLGMGSMEGSCGAVEAAALIAGTKARQIGLNKQETYKVCSKISKEFKAKNQSVICRELKGVGTGKILRSCNDCVKDAAEILGNALKDLEEVK